MRSHNLFLISGIQGPHGSSHCYLFFTKMTKYFFICAAIGLLPTDTEYGMEEIDSWLPR